MAGPTLSIKPQTKREALARLGQLQAECPDERITEDKLLRFLLGRDAILAGLERRGTVTTATVPFKSIEQLRAELAEEAPDAR
jgi:hypothetical protein